MYSKIFWQTAKDSHEPQSLYLGNETCVALLRDEGEYENLSVQTLGISDTKYVSLYKLCGKSYTFSTRKLAYIYRDPQPIDWIPKIGFPRDFIRF